MSLPEPPEYLEELSSEQREKLLEFIVRFDKTMGFDGFDADTEWDDIELLTTALRVAEILGFEGQRLEQLFRREFGISGMGEEGVLGDMLAIAMLVDGEHRLLCKAGGRN
jgi:hypothetical protein